MELQKPNKLKPEQQTQLCPHKPVPSDFSRRPCTLGSVNLTRALEVTNQSQVCYTFVPCSGVVQLVARQPLELVILVRVQAPEPSVSSCGQNPPEVPTRVPENFQKEIRRSLGCRNPARLGWGHNFQFGGTLCFEMLFAAMQEPFKFLFRAARNSR
jgi:hypothetical protein